MNRPTEATATAADRCTRPHLPADTVLLRRGTRSVLLSRRTAVVCAALVVLLFVLAALACSIGTITLSPNRAALALFGQGDRLDVLLVQQIRVPRVAAGMLCGAALGMAGCLTQTLSGNRLATPDLMGVSGGATAAVLFAVTAGSASALGNWWLGPVGAAAAAGLVVAAAGGLGPRGHRMLVVGLGLSTVMNALTNLAMEEQNLQSAGGLFVWAQGSLNGRGWPSAGPVALCLAALLPPALVAGHRLRMLRFDDDVATSLGVHLGRVRLLALAIAVALAGLSAGIAGPVGFLALAAPVVASRLTGPERVPIMSSALLGAVLITAADMIGRVVASTEIPVGVVTSVLGGPFLLWVLFGENRRRRRPRGRGSARGGGPSAGGPGKAGEER